jgi:hypothetical protein
MLDLSTKEILAELRRLGIDNTPDLKSLCREYVIYHVMHNHQGDDEGTTIHDGSECNREKDSSHDK